MKKICITGDTGTGNNEQYLVAKSLENYQKSNDISAVLLLGDNIYENGVTSKHDPQFQTKFETPYSNINVPFYLCLGNHDYGNNHFTSNAYDMFAKHQIDYSKISNKWNLPRRYYSKIIGPCEFFFLDTNLDLMSQQVIQKQLRTMKHKIRKSKKKWKILCGHHTWRSSGGHGNADPILEKFLTDLVSGTNICAYLCGHDHCKNVITMPFPQGKRKTKRKKNKQLHCFVIGTGGKAYDDSLFTPSNIQKDAGETLLLQNSKLGFIGLTMTTKQLIFEIYDVNHKHTKLVKTIII